MPEPTYEAHKAKVDAAHPTPPIDWRLHSDNVAHKYDDYAIATCELAFDGETWTYEVHAQGPPEVPGYTVRSVDGELQVRPSFLGYAYEEWATCRDKFAAAWAEICESRRSYMAMEALAREVMVNAGITLGVVNLSALGLGGPSQAVVALSPEFDSDVLAYTATTSFSNIAMLAVASPGATVTWDVGEASIVGESGAVASVDLSAGDNVIMVTASRFEWTPTTYTITVTRS